MDDFKGISGRLSSILAISGIKEGKRLVLKDDLLSGITIEDLVITLQSNEKVINETSVKKVFNEMVKANVADATFVLKGLIKDIIKESN